MVERRRRFARGRIISLLTDFGEDSPYAGAMKGVILQICPKAQIVDISHAIPHFDVRYAAYVLAESAPFFPPGSIHLAVVDPGVGTERRPIVAETKHYLFVGPDNGLLSIAAGRDGVVSAWEIQNPRYVLDKLSRTFHGRDIFAPVAAHLANGVPLEDIGRRLDSFEVLQLAEPRLEGDELLGEVLFVDPFGNLVTNITRSKLMELPRHRDAFAVCVGDTIKEIRLLSTYGEAKPGAPLILPGSSGLLEIAVNRGSAAEFFHATLGAPVRLKATP